MEEKEEKSGEKQTEIPKHLIVLKVLGFVLLSIGLVLSIIGLCHFGDFESKLFALAMAGLPVFGIGLMCLLAGFSPSFAKMGAKTTKYIQSQNKEDLRDISSTRADIQSEAVTKTARAIKKGLSDTKYCRHCGKEIESDSTFCKYCGKSQN